MHVRRAAEPEQEAFDPVVGEDLVERSVPGLGLREQSGERRGRWVAYRGQESASRYGAITRCMRRSFATSTSSAGLALRLSTARASAFTAISTPRRFRTRKQSTIVLVTPYT